VGGRSRATPAEEAEYRDGATPGWWRTVDLDTLPPELALIAADRRSQLVSDPHTPRDLCRCGVAIVLMGTRWAHLAAPGDPPDRAMETPIGSYHEAAPTGAWAVK
jgi:hypothetical protein